MKLFLDRYLCFLNYKIIYTQKKICVIIKENNKVINLTVGDIIKSVTVAVIGGGAAGIISAITCARALGKGSKVAIIEKQTRVGRKLLATGNGRCNITNRNVSPEHYYGDRQIINTVLEGFSPSDSESFFGEMGILFRDDDEGRVYPYSNQAATVLDCMRAECSRLGVEELCDFSVLSIKKENGMFIITSTDIKIKAEYVIIATGSQASPLLGSNDSGYRLLHSLGIESTPLYPSLSPVYTKEKYKNLKGVRAKGDISLIADNKVLKKRSGEIQFTDYGLSGICVFEISRFVNEFFMLGKISDRKVNEIKLSVDVMSEYSFSNLCIYLQKCKKIFAESKAMDILSGALNRKLSQSITEYCKLSNKPCKSLTDSDIKKIAGAVKNFVFTPIISDGYKSAQVGAGGINSEYIDPKTLMSRKIKNLFVCGELLDVDGDCGGYNLHFAFGSGMIPSKTISKKI